MTLTIAGGGIAGAAAACLLAQNGVGVRVLERSLGPSDKICGEFLSAEAQHYLRLVGIDPMALGGHPITKVRLVRGADSVAANLPFRGVGLSRFVLDEALLDRAAACGAEIIRGAVVSDLSPDMQFLATGKHDLRGARRTLTSKAEPLVGFKTYFRLTRPERNGLSGTVEVILFRGGYAGLQMVEGGRANLCLLVHRDRLAAAGGTWETLLGDLQCESAHLRARLLGAEPLLPRPLTIAHVPYGFVHAPSSDDTIYRLGDQACVIPSFSGDGMSMALHSAALAVHCHSRGIPPQAYHRLLARHVRTPIRRAMALYRVANTPIGQTMMFQALRLWPGLMRLSAELTRVARNDWVAA